jgi:hypothetical protein
MGAMWKHNWKSLPDNAADPRLPPNLARGQLHRRALSDAHARPRRFDRLEHEPLGEHLRAGLGRRHYGGAAWHPNGVRDVRLRRSDRLHDDGDFGRRDQES